MATLFFFLVFFGNINAQEKSIEEAHLIGCWKFYPEESRFFPGMEVYRPCDYDFLEKLRRFRFTIDFKRNGECKYLTLAPNDGHYMSKGTWAYDAKKRKLTIFDLNQKLVKNYKISRLENNLLCFEK